MNTASHLHSFINTFKLLRALPLLRLKLQEMKRKSHVFVKKLNFFFLLRQYGLRQKIYAYLIFFVIIFLMCNLLPNIWI